jgi:hypothetical protein
MKSKAATPNPSFHIKDYIIYIHAYFLLLKNKNQRFYEYNKFFGFYPLALGQF